jgi:bifunctional non-homologous end joining protein LigD
MISGVALTFIQPMAARVVDTLPEGDDWMYEVKFDGYRALLMKDGKQIRIRSRNDKDLTHTYRSITAAGAKLKATRAVVDGEIVALAPNGRPSFQALQHRGAHPGHTIVFYAFDLLHLDDQDLTTVPLERRRQRLPEVLDQSGVLLSIELPGTARQVIDAVTRLGLEGVIAKRRSSKYTPGDRNTSWVKLKLDRQQEFVIGGYRPGPSGIDAIVVGYYDGGRLSFAAKVRAGFTPHVRREVFALLKRRQIAHCPFVDLPSGPTSHWGGGVTPEQMDEIQWVAPELVAQVRFVEWTAEGHLRHAAFLGLRQDKPPRQITRET